MSTGAEVLRVVGGGCGYVAVSARQISISPWREDTGFLLRASLCYALLFLNKFTDGYFSFAAEENTGTQPSSKTTHK